MKKLILGVMMACACGLYAADEILTQVILTATKQNVDVKQQPTSQQVDWNGQDVYSETVNLTTNPAALAKGSIGDCGYAFFRNITTNYALKISFEADFGTEAMHLKAGEFSLVRLATNCIVTNMRARAAGDVTNAATATLYYCILED